MINSANTGQQPQLPQLQPSNSSFYQNRMEDNVPIQQQHFEAQQQDYEEVEQQQIQEQQQQIHEQQQIIHEQQEQIQEHKVDR